MVILQQFHGLIPGILTLDHCGVTSDVVFASLRTFRHISLALVAVAFGLVTVLADAPPTPLATALEGRKLSFEANGNGRDQLTFTLKNASPTPVTVAIPAGLIATGAAPEDRVVVVREAMATVPAQNALEVSLPVVALSSKSAAKQQPFTLQTASEPRLTPLLKALADQPDAPRPTVQLAVLGLLEDINFAQWRQFSGATGDMQPTPAEITQAIDALGLLRVAAPQGTFALGNDTELKLRALRNPWSRAKAVALYGLDPGGDAVAPDLRQLLHTQPGDNCPICRQRALMQKQGDIP